MNLLGRNIFLKNVVSALILLFSSHYECYKNVARRVGLSGILEIIGICFFKKHMNSIHRNLDLILPLH